MTDPFTARADAVQNILLEMERKAAPDDLFALGYMIPQIGLVLEMAEYEPQDVSSDDFDHTYWQWLEIAFGQDSMNDNDRQRIEELWHSATLRADTAGRTQA
ncbi:YfcL family protein [Phytohalomonas tamaricis]|uniref:YfcL family protein n=1 Tax=Phytohalomonas tamaricis TaxID=2081032 RepID=UPI000D0BB22E|nr:YfcL family protein [Phytohalomonas tamaricis]